MRNLKRWKIYLTSRKKKIDAITKDIIGFLSAVDALLNSQEKAAEHLRALFPDDSNSYTNSLILAQLNVIDKLKEEKKKLETDIDRDFQAPIHSYLAQYREIEDRIAERKRRRTKMDEINDKVDKYKEKGDNRYDSEELKLKYAREGYDELNEELMNDIPKLLDDSDKFFTPLMQNIIYIQSQFWALMANFGENLVKETNVTSSQPIEVTLIITSRDKSSVVRTYSSMSNPYEQQQNKNNPYLKQGVSTGQGQGQGQGQGSNNPLPPLPPLPGRSSTPGVKAEGMWDFVAQNQNELSFAKGDSLNILEQNGEWWKAEKNGIIGLVPSNYVQLK